MKQSIIALLLVFLIPHCLLAQKTATLIYIDQYKDIAVKEMKRTGIPASITLAQGIIESNSGQSNLALNFKNHFGIKCKSDWQGETTYQDDDAKQECFRVYPTAARSFIDHSDFLKNRPNYAPLFELDPVDDSAWAYGLKKAGYATATDYPRKLIKVIADFELSQYNFPELAKEDSLEAANKKTIDKDAIQISKVDSAVVKIEAIRKDTIAKDTAVVVKKVIILTTDSVQLSPVRGISGTVAVVNTSPNTPNAIQPINELKTVPKLDTVQRMDTVSKKTNKNKTNYPSIRFRINDVPVVWAQIQNLGPYAAWSPPRPRRDVSGLRRKGNEKPARTLSGSHSPRGREVSAGHRELGKPRWPTVWIFKPWSAEDGHPQAHGGERGENQGHG